MHYTTPLHDPYTTTLAAALATQQSPPNVIADAGDPTPPTLSATNPYLLGMADAIIGNIVMPGVGFQRADSLTPGVQSTSSTTLVDMPGAFITFVAPVAKNYGVIATVNPLVATLGQEGAVALVINGSQGAEQRVLPAQSSYTQQVTLLWGAACAAGNNTIKLQWRSSGAYSISSNSTTKVQMLVIG